MGKAGPETRLVKKMKDAGKAKYGEGLVIVTYHGGPFTEAGVSDLLCCLNGHFGAAEVKAPEAYGNSVEKALEKGPTVKQLAFLSRINKAGGIACVVADVPGFMAFLETLERGEWDED